VAKGASWEEATIVTADFCGSLARYADAVSSALGHVLGIHCVGTGFHGDSKRDFAGIRFRGKLRRRLEPTHFWALQRA
jgi:hypothetical protein